MFLRIQDPEIPLFSRSGGEIDVKMRYVFAQQSTVLAFPNKMASKRWPCGAEYTAKMIFQNDFLNDFFV